MNTPVTTCPACQREIEAQASNCPFCFSPIRAASSAVSTDDLATRIQGSLDAGEKIAAIREYRQATGAGLAEAKSAVEAFAAGAPLTVSSKADPTGHWQVEVLDLMRQGKKIQAIKIYREANGGGLKESKAAVEELAAAHGIEAGGSGCLTVIVAVFLAAVLYSVFVAA